MTIHLPYFVNCVYSAKNASAMPLLCAYLCEKSEEKEKHENERQRATTRKKMNR